MSKISRFYYLGSLHVALATGVCAAAFMKLVSGNPFQYPLALLQIVLTCWLIYILDRLLDVIKSDSPPETLRHRYHFDNQYNLQILVVALGSINMFLLFFQPMDLILFGGMVALGVLIYLTVIVRKWPASKDFFMPIIYTLAVVGVPFVLAPSIFFSSWIAGAMFLFMVYQNILGFAYFENGNSRKRKAVIYLAGLNLFIFMLLFVSSLEYVNRLALIVTLISIMYSLIVSNEGRFRRNYRWIMDSLLFLPLLLILF